MEIQFQYRNLPNEFHEPLKEKGNESLQLYRCIVFVLIKRQTDAFKLMSSLLTTLCIFVCHEYLFIDIYFTSVTNQNLIIVQMPIRIYLNENHCNSPWKMQFYKTLNVINNSNKLEHIMHFEYFTFNIWPTSG